MAMYHSICWNDCIPNGYKEIRQKIQNHFALNNEEDFNFPNLQSPRGPLVNRQKWPKTDKDAYEMCCAPKKRKPANLKKELRPAKIAEAPPRDKITRSYVTPPIVKNTTPKWRKEHETKLKENAEAQELEKQKLITQNWIRKREAMDKFQRYLELNKTQTARRSLEMEKESPYRNPSKTEAPSLLKKMKPKPSSDSFERSLLKQVSKTKISFRGQKSLTQVGTPFGLYHKNKGVPKRSKRFGSSLEKEDTMRSGLHPTLKSRHVLEVSKPKNKTQNSFDRKKKPAKHPDTFQKVLKSKSKEIPELKPKLKSHKRLKVTSSKDNNKIKKETNQGKAKTTKIGAKFSWESKKVLKFRKHFNPKAFKDLIKDSELDMPERIPLLKSRTELGSNIKHVEKKAGKVSAGKELEPNFGFRAPKTEPKNVDNIMASPSKPFYEMIKDTETTSPELNRALASNYRIFNAKAKPKASTHLDRKELPLPKKKETVKEDEPSRHFENVLVWRETHPPALRPVRKQKPEANTTRQPKFRSSSFLDYDQISLRPNKSSVSKARSSSSRGDRISLKEFYHYIKNSIPDKKIYRQMYSTDKTDLNSKTSNQSISDRTSRTAGSIISTTSIAQSMLAKPKQGESKDEKVKSCQSQYLIGLNLREQWRPDLYIDERTSVENRIKELMKEVSIRQDFQPLRPPRDFITENILRIGLLKRNKKSDTKAKVKQREKYPTLNEVLTVPGDHTMRFSKRDQPKTIRIRRYSKGLSKGHLDPYQSRNPKSPPEESACSLTERRKCDCYICSLFLKGKEQKDSPLIQKAKVQRRRYELRSYYQKMRRRERELEQEQCCEKIC